MNTISMLIDGEPKAATGNATFERANPFDGQIATRAPAATAGDAVAAVEAAATDFPNWAATGPSERRAPRVPHPVRDLPYQWPDRA